MKTLNELQKQAADTRGYATAQANLAQLMAMMQKRTPTPPKDSK